MSLQVLAMSRITILLPDPETKYILAYPEFFIEAGKATLRRILRECCRYGWLNRAAIDTLDLDLPNLEETIRRQDADRIEKLRKEWEYQKTVYQHDFLNPDPDTFPSDWTKKQKQQERRDRKQHNSCLLREVNRAEQDYRRAQAQAPKRIEKAREVVEIFRAAKEDYRAYA